MGRHPLWAGGTIPGLPPGRAAGGVNHKRHPPTNPYTSVHKRGLRCLNEHNPGPLSPVPCAKISTKKGTEAMNRRIYDKQPTSPTTELSNLLITVVAR